MSPLALIDLIFTLLWLAILGRVIISWVRPKGGDPISNFLIQVTEPILQPIRKIVPPLGMFDLTPMIALILLSVIQSVLLSSL